MGEGGEVGSGGAVGAGGAVGGVGASNASIKGGFNHRLRKRKRSEINFLSLLVIVLQM